VPSAPAGVTAPPGSALLALSRLQYDNACDK